MYALKLPEYTAFAAQGQSCLGGGHSEINESFHVSREAGEFTKDMT